MTVDSVGVFLGAVQSGLVVSGNAYITLTRVMNSGDALSSFRVSGPNDFIGIRLQPGRGEPLTGSYFTQIAESVVVIYHHDTTFATSGVSQSGASVAAVQRLTNDFKLTVSGATWATTSSGVYTGMAPPKLVMETHPLAVAQFAHATLQYRVRYLL